MTTYEPGAVLEVAVVGYSLGGATFHAPFINSTPGMRLAAIVTRDPERRAKAQSDYPHVRVVDTVDDLWSLESRIDLVAISSPSGTHFTLAKTVLEHGASVVVDKPFAASVAEAREVADLAVAHGTLAIPFQNRRWDGDFLTVQRLLREGTLGVVHRYESRFDRWRLTQKPRWCVEGAQSRAEGIVYDIGSHLVDQALVLFGPAASVYAEADWRHPDVRVEDDAFIALTHVNGVRSHLYMTSIAAQPSLRMGVWGSRGAYIKHGLDGQEPALIAGVRPGDAGWGEERPELWGAVGLGADARPIRTELGAYERFYAGVADAVLRGAPSPVTVGEAMASLTVIEAALLSAREGRAVAL